MARRGNPSWLIIVPVLTGVAILTSIASNVLAIRRHFTSAGGATGETVAATGGAVFARAQNPRFSSLKQVKS